MTQATFEFPETAHSHLRLTRQVPSGPRAMKGLTFAPTVRHPDQPKHARTLRDDLTQLRAIHASRRNVLGVSPENVAVFEFSAPPDESRLSGAGLTVLEWFTDRVVVTAPGDPGMAGLIERLDQYQTGPRPAVAATDGDPSAEGTVDNGEADAPPRPAPHQGLFDVIEHVRALSMDEVLTPAAKEAIASGSMTETLTLDLQCWCPEDEKDARLRQERTMAAVKAGGGSVLDKTLRHRSGLSLIRVDVTASLASELVQLPDVRRVDRLPRPARTHAEAIRGGADLLPLALAPARDSPLIAIVDSGVRSSHPLLSPAFVGSFAVQSLEAERDGSGHGTFVASLALYGSLEPLLDRPSEPVTPAGRLLSVRVLADNNEFPQTELWENDLLWALETAAAEGARIINLSIGDPRRPYVPARPTPLAAAIDEVIRRLDLVVVISTGNTTAHIHDIETQNYDFTARLLDFDDTGMLDPATSALALTVGALGSDDGQGAREARTNIDARPFGAANVPSPLTRRGPGASNMIKPELAAPGGHLVHIDADRYPRLSVSTGVLGANGTDPDKVLSVDVGTSYAAPLVSYIAARALGANPGLSSRGVRALVLSSIHPLGPYLLPANASSAEQQRRLNGYGRADAERAAHSSDHRAVLVAEESLQVDNVHLYVVPIPSSFFDSSGWRRVTVAVAFDPETRSTRLNYLGSRMQVHVYRGVTVNAVADAYLAERQAPVSAQEVAEDDSPDDARVTGPAAIAQFQLELQPVPKFRSRGAHLYGTALRKTRLDRSDGEEYVIAVQSLNRWRPPESIDRYALAVVLERDRDHAPIYGELFAALDIETLAEVQAEVRLQ
ncbi:S8 family peptidase [Georgenia wangjunii]|uniref:S8 family peptidase n=1 Tax=Georgenia wangjunii TaxID=3117730 RepID=UPI002F26501C